MVKYLCDTDKISETKRTETPRNTSRTGYGRKLPTSMMLRIVGSKTWYRVYVMCWSNCERHMPFRNGETLVVRDYDLPEDNMQAEGEDPAIIEERERMERAYERAQYLRYKGD